MNNLNDVLTLKISRVQTFNDELTSIQHSIEKLDDRDREALPIFRGKFSESEVTAYLEELRAAAKNPLRSKRKKALTELGISIGRINDDLFDNDNIDQTINLLNELVKEEFLFTAITKKCPSWIVKESFASVNAQLRDIKAHASALKESTQKIKSKDLRDYLIEQYVDGNTDILSLQSISAEIVKLENALGITVNKDEFELQLVDEVHKLLGEVEDFGKPFTPCRNLVEAKENLEKQLKALRKEFDDYKSELDYWSQLYEVYVPKGMDINLLRQKLEEAKNECETRYKSIHCLEQVYQNSLYSGVELKDFANKLETIFGYVKDITLGSINNIKEVERIYEHLMKLEKIGYKDIEGIFQEISFANAEDFVKRVNKLSAEYESLKKEWEMYQRLLESIEPMPADYPGLKVEVEKYKNEAIISLGKDFENIVRFLRDETLELNVDKLTLENFIKCIKPQIKEVLKL
jgi:hypothetical protein